jgi:hypothetical protein
LWEIAKALQIPLDNKITTLTELPYTISYVIRKRLQVSSLHEMPKDKRPPEMTIWDGTSEEIEEWIDRVYGTKEAVDPYKSEFLIDYVEG